jgi:hypothetical protein
MEMKNRFPKGWNEARVRELLEHNETQAEEEAVAEDEAAFRRRDNGRPERTRTYNWKADHARGDPSKRGNRVTSKIIRQDGDTARRSSSTQNLLRAQTPRGSHF